MELTSIILLAYCKMDTLAMVRIFEKLKGLNKEVNDFVNL